MKENEVLSLQMIAARVRAEYREMPGLSLTLPQAARLLGVQPTICQTVLQALVLDGVLYHTPRGTYIATPPTRAFTWKEETAS
jgi:hypothetical protein